MEGEIRSGENSKCQFERKLQFAIFREAQPIIERTESPFGNGFGLNKLSSAEIESWREGEAVRKGYGDISLSASSKGSPLKE